MMGVGAKRALGLYRSCAPRHIIAAFSPSGESLDGPAHFYHRLLLTELLYGGHKTLGDAVLAAQSKFAESGGYLELLSIYHLFGDPAMSLH